MKTFQKTMKICYYHQHLYSNGMYSIPPPKYYTESIWILTLTHHLKAFIVQENYDIIKFILWWWENTSYFLVLNKKIDSSLFTTFNFQVLLNLKTEYVS